ncbi:MAG: hypothetical protein FJX62_01360 [Alphaproteobacteria bacterium]|nr:hypothetical protein [Alphaproteobacteria bacterium]
MMRFPAKLMIAVFGLAFATAAALPTAAEAAKSSASKKKATAAASVAAKGKPRQRTAQRARPGYWGTDLVPAGPIYFANEYLGDDPDPNIRFELMRDMTRFGGYD